MAETVIAVLAEIVIAGISKVSEYLVAPIGRHLGYLFCYRTHTHQLRNNVQKLGTARNDLQLTIDEATRRGDEIRPIVQDWLARVDEITGEAEELLMKDENNNISCFNLKSRYQLGRQASKKAQDIDGIQPRNFPEGISYHLPPQTATVNRYESFESRDSTLKEIMNALRDDEMKIIGVWGMGGVGKTTMLKQVAEQAKQGNLFATQVYVDVSCTREEDKTQEAISKIQQHISDRTGLEFKNEAQSTKADKLKQRLKSEKILIVIDDIWKEVNLEDVGILSCKVDDDQKDCKIVLASRDRDILSRDMGAQICFLIQHLQEEDAWRLFKKTAGDCVEGDQLRPTAKEVVKECMGLPVAIVTIAKALKDKTVAVWKNALVELRTAAPTNISGVEEKVYGCLKWSYNHLNGDDVKSLFLLCGSLSYGDISMVHLLSYAMGLDSFTNIKSLEEARNKLVTLMTILKASSLLLAGEDHRYYFDYFDHSERGASRLLFMYGDDDKTVRMHDVVRDVARNIASNDPYQFKVIADQDWSKTKEFKFIYLNCEAVHELPQRLVCPKLQFFLLQNDSLSLDIPNTFFEGMNQLKVLDLSGIDFETLPSTLQSLANLRTLCLDRCKLGDIAGIGELKKLQVLSMVDSDIKHLPKEIGQLTNLRLLNLNDCKALAVIPQNIFSKLSGLECLFMRSSFSKWTTTEVSDGESNIACLSELNHLTTIEVEILDAEMVPKEDNFFQNLTSFAIFIGNFNWSEKRFERSKTLRLNGTGDGSLLLRNGMFELLEKIEELKLRELEGIRCLFSPSMLVSFLNLKYLSISHCGMEDKGKGNVSVSNPTEDGVFFSEKVSFPNLERLKLIKLPELKKIWSHQLPLSSFSNLEILRVEDCPSGPNLIPGHLIQSFKNLKEIEVKNCPILEHVFDLRGYGTNGETLPKLEILKLKNLYELKGICNNRNLSSFISVSFHNLRCLSIEWCGKQDKDQENVDISVEDAVLFGDEVSFPDLEEVTLKGLPRLKKIWHDNLSIDSFSNLRNLRVESCDALEYVFDLNEILQNPKTLPLENQVGTKNDSTRGCFSSFMHVSSHNLKRISICCRGKEDKDQRNVNTPIEGIVHFDGKVSFPILEEVTLENLPELKKIWHL